MTKTYVITHRAKSAQVDMCIRTSLHDAVQAFLAAVGNAAGMVGVRPSEISKLRRDASNAVWSDPKEDHTWIMQNHKVYLEIL